MSRAPTARARPPCCALAAALCARNRGACPGVGGPLSAPPAEYQAELAYASHEPALKGDLTALENLHFMVGLKRRVDSNELLATLGRTGVAALADLPTRVLSAGQRRRVAMARVLAYRAALWLLDEPFTNLDAAGSALMSSLLEEHVSQGGMALVVAHHDLNLATATRRLELQG